MAISYSSKAIYDRIAPSLRTYQGSRLFGTSYLDQYRNASAGLDELSGMYSPSINGATRDRLDRVASGLRGQQGSAIAGGALATIGGLTNIYSTFDNLTSLPDTSFYRNAIDDINQVGRYNYGSYDQLASDYSRLGGMTPDFDYETIRGMNTGQKVGNVLSSTVSGATAGLQVGGPWGALAGGVLGLGAGIGGWIKGDRNAEAEKGLLENRANLANYAAQLNLNAATESYADSRYRAGVANRAEAGGKLERRQLSLREFAENAMKKRRAGLVAGNTVQTGRIIRQHCKGGTMVRIKVR